MNIAIYASGGGSNARKIIEHFQHSDRDEVKLVVASKKQAGVLQHAASLGISSHILDRKSFYQRKEIIQLMDFYKIDIIVLAGFLWLVPEYLIQHYPDRILNIHPSLLPKYGGKGMYGMHVHRAVVEADEKESGMTIHLVNEEYDKGKVLYQGVTNIELCTTPEAVAAAVLTLEHDNYARVIEEYITSVLS